jgi:hypothetical protein
LYKKNFTTKVNLLPFSVSFKHTHKIFEPMTSQSHNGGGNSNRERDQQFWLGVLGLMRKLGYKRSLVKLSEGNFCVENYEYKEPCMLRSGSSNGINFGKECDDNNNTYLVEISGGIAKFYRKGAHEVMI